MKIAQRFCLQDLRQSWAWEEGREQLSVHPRSGLSCWGSLALCGHLAVLVSGHSLGRALLHLQRTLPAAGSSPGRTEGSGTSSLNIFPGSRQCLISFPYVLIQVATLSAGRQEASF